MIFSNVLFLCSTLDTYHLNSENLSKLKTVVLTDKFSRNFVQNDFQANSIVRKNNCGFVAEKVSIVQVILGTK